jgi:hypothetical protein
VPTIDALTAQGRRAGQPSRFAEVGETIDVSATVRDAETPADDMTYLWSATSGTFQGTGRTVTWTAPGTASGPVTLTLKLTENYGHSGQPRIYKHELTATIVVRLHDSTREIGDMAVRFLDEFSRPQSNKDWQDVMKDFKGSACPQPSLADAERTDVINHYTNYFMHDYDLGTPSVSVGFAGTCPFRARPGDACVAVQVFWDSTDTRSGLRLPARGIDHLTAVYANDDSRWWLCSSDFEPTGSLGHGLYAR